MLSFDDGVRTGSHTKYIKDALAGKENVKISEDGESLLEGEFPTEEMIKGEGP